MPTLETGVKGYVKAQAIVTVNFPIDLKGNAEINCRQCQFFRVSSNSCALNGEICAFPNKYIGAFCPLDIVEETGG